MKNMKITFLLSIAMMLVFSISAQDDMTLDQVKTKKAEVDAKIADAEATLAGLKGEAKDLKGQIEVLSGWMTGVSGTVGFGINSNKNWVSSPNPNANSTSLALGLAAYANNIKDKTLWRNSLIASKEWQDVDKGDEEGEDGLFDNGTVDILNISSLYGYRITPKLAATALGELNTSIGNFLKPGTADIGVGVTWTPTNNLVVIVHPLNYHFAFSEFDNIETTSALGAKLRAEYNNKFTVLGKDVGFSSTFTSFLPYKDEKTLIDPPGGRDSWEAGLFEYTWLNNLSFSVWKGIGVGVGFGLRSAEFESQDLQTYYSVGLNYAF